MVGGQFDKQPDQLLKRCEAAALLGVCPATLAKYPVRFVEYKKRACARYWRSDVLAFRAASLKQVPVTADD